MQDFFSHCRTVPEKNAMSGGRWPAVMLVVEGLDYHNSPKRDQLTAAEAINDIGLGCGDQGLILVLEGSDYCTSTQRYG